MRHAALAHIERVSLTRVDLAAFASARTLRSAVETLGVPRHRATAIPMGAHIIPHDPATVAVPASPPTRSDCRLLIVASDPRRKRVDLAVRATELLRKRGFDARLTVVGRGTPTARRSEVVDDAGVLRLADPSDAQRHHDLLRDSHIQLLPSVGEAFGIAPAESAHFARPSIVSDVGGLPGVVLHDRTGLVLPVGAGHEQWAEAIAALVGDPDRYRRYSEAALRYARTELNWSVWAARVIALMVSAIDAPAAGPTLCPGSAVDRFSA